MDVNCENSEIVCHTNTNIAELTGMPASGGLTCYGALCAGNSTANNFPIVTGIDRVITKIKHTVPLLYFKIAVTVVVYCIFVNEIIPSSSQSDAP